MRAGTLPDMVTDESVDAFRLHAEITIHPGCTLPDADL